MKKLCTVFLTLFLIVFPIMAQGRGSYYEEEQSEIIDTRNLIAGGKQWAVFIAIDEYQDWGQLLYPVKDARDVKSILIDYYLIDEIRELYNREATAAAIRRLFIELQDKTGPNDSVFVFHAGHGFNDERTSTSAWIPYDGGLDRYAQANWLSHLQIRSMLDSLKAKHVFLVSDSCFSGDLLDTSRGAAETVVNYPAAYDRVSRQAMSSGASEEVDDVSEFASRLKNTLLRTDAAFITPDYLLSQIKEAETVRPLRTIPILAAIPRSSHQLGGSFLFFRKNARPNAAVQPVPAPTVNPAPVVEPAPAVQGAPGEYGYFVGSWIATVEHELSYDTYEITLSANGRCTVKLTNDIAEQETTGNWSWDGSMFRLSAVFRNPPIAYQQNIQWVSIVSFAGGNNAFNILGRTATNGPTVRFTFFRD